MMHLYMKETAYGLYLLSLRKLLTYLLTYLVTYLLTYLMKQASFIARQYAYAYRARYC